MQVVNKLKIKLIKFFLFVEFFFGYGNLYIIDNFFDVFYFRICIIEDGSLQFC